MMLLSKCRREGIWDPKTHMILNSGDCFSDTIDSKVTWFFFMNSISANLFYKGAEKQHILKK